MSSKGYEILKVVIVDDDRWQARVIRARLKPFSDFTVLEDCETGVAGLAAIRRTTRISCFLTYKCRLEWFRNAEAAAGIGIFHNFLNCL